MERETCTEIARLDERISALAKLIDERKESADRALRLAASELSVHLQHLNGEQGRMSEMQSRLLPREMFDLKTQELLDRVTRLELEFRETRGRLWLPMIMVAGAASTLAAGLMKLL